MINQCQCNEISCKEYDRARSVILRDIVEYVVKKYPSDKKLQESYNYWAIQYIVQSRKLFTPFMEKFMEKDHFWVADTELPSDELKKLAFAMRHAPVTSKKYVREFASNLSIGVD